MLSTKGKYFATLPLSLLPAILLLLRYKVSIIQTLNKMGKNIHVTPHPGGGWQVKGAGNSKATKVTSTQKESIGAAIPMAKNNGSEVVIHARNGQIRDKDSYGIDPSSIKDTKF